LFGKSALVSLHRLIERLCIYTVESGKVGIKHDLNTSDGKYAVLNILYDHQIILSHSGITFFCFRLTSNTTHDNEINL